MARMTTFHAKRILFTGLLALALGAAGSFTTRGVAYAQQDNKAAAGGTQYKKVTHYDFDDDTVTGEMVRPDGEFIGSRTKTVHSSLIKLRANFVPEMLKSANEI